MHITRLSKSTSSAIKNHSGVKTCRVAGTTSPTEPAAETTKKTIGAKLSRHNFQIPNVDHLGKVYSNVPQKVSRPQEDKMLDIDFNRMIWGIFMSDHAGGSTSWTRLQGEFAYNQE